MRNELKRYSNWPTFPRLYVNGEFIGGCDIVIEMYKIGELKQLLTNVGSAGAASREHTSARGTVVMNIIFRV